MSSLRDLVMVLDEKHQAKAMEMLKEHKDYLLLLAFVKDKQEQEEMEKAKRREARLEQKRQDEALRLDQKRQEEALRLELAKLSIKERALRRKEEEEDDPPPSLGYWGDVGAACDYEAWQKRKAYRDRIYSQVK
jgi:hypothetical protein